MRISKWFRWASAGLATVMLVGCGEQPQPRERKAAPPATVSKSGGDEQQSTAQATPKEATKKVAEGWGTIKGKLVYNGPTLDPAKLDVQKDPEYCVDARMKAGMGPIVAEDLVVTGDNAIANAIVFMNVRGVPPIHPDYPQTKDDVAKADAEKFKELNEGLTYDDLNSLTGNHDKLKALKAPVLLDQVFCQYVPHGLALREGQKVIALNYEEVAHNILITSLGGNSSNINMTPNSFLVYEWVKEARPLDLKCSIHGWMNAFAMVFEHPYFDVTDDSGSFELKNVPAGEVSLVIVNPKELLGGRANPYKVTVGADETVELEITYDGTKATATKKS